jgi:hypothetical protein
VATVVSILRRRDAGGTEQHQRRRGGKQGHLHGASFSDGFAATIMRSRD